MSDYFHPFLFGVYPYICLVVLLLGSLVRFDREQYTWKSDSSQLLRHGALRLGSNGAHLERHRVDRVSDPALSARAPALRRPTWTRCRHR